jgi:cell division protein FtsW (lipid II flippase)
MQSITSQISNTEKRRYALCQALSWVLALTCLVLFVTLDDQTWKRVTLAGLFGFLLAAAVLNYGRRFGIRVLWSKWSRD